MVGKNGAQLKRMNFNIPFLIFVFAGVYYFFGFLLLSLIVLLIINRIATKYIKGDFIEVDDDTDDDEEEEIEEINEGEVQTVAQSNSTISPYKEISPADVFHQAFFGTKLSLVVSLRYFQDNQKIQGVVKSVSRLDDKVMELVNVKFKAWTTSATKYEGMTGICKSLSTKDEESVLALSFMLGPVANEEILNASICIQMYGKQKGLKHHKSKCFGECYINLTEIIGKLDGVEFTKTLMPVAVCLSDA